MEKEEVLKLINQYWNTIPIDRKPTVGSVNTAFFVYENMPKLIKLEKQNNKIGIGDYGFTMLSFIATITDLLCGERLAAVVEEGKIIGWDFYKES